MRDDFDFRFQGPGMYGDNFYNQFWLDENRLYHREDGPAVIDTDGNRYWFWRDELHRDGGLPAVEYKDGGREWFEHGKRHRDNGPAIVHADGKEEWWNHGRKLETEEIISIRAKCAAETAAAAGEQAAEAVMRGLEKPLPLSKPPRFRH